MRGSGEDPHANGRQHSGFRHRTGLAAGSSAPPRPAPTARRRRRPSKTASGLAPAAQKNAPRRCRPEPRLVRLLAQSRQLVVRELADPASRTVSSPTPPCVASGSFAGDLVLPRHGLAGLELAPGPRPRPVAAPLAADKISSRCNSQTTSSSSSASPPSAPSTGPVSGTAARQRLATQDGPAVAPPRSPPSTALAARLHPLRSGPQMNKSRVAAGLGHSRAPD
jgi:hypothetical protein